MTDAMQLITSLIERVQGAPPVVLRADQPPYILLSDEGQDHMGRELVGVLIADAPPDAMASWEAVEMFLMRSPDQVQERIDIWYGPISTFAGLGQPSGAFGVFLVH